MKTGWLFFKLAFAARGPFDSSPVYFNEDGPTCPGVYIFTKILVVIGKSKYQASPSVGTALFTLEIMEEKELLLSF